MMMMGFLLKSHRFIFYFLVVYLIFILSLTIPYVQRGAIYLHWVRLPIQANFDAPESYGISFGQVKNFYLTTPDGAKIGVWHALPEAVYVRHLRKSTNSSTSLLKSYTDPIPTSVFENALRTHKTVLYSHGNAASRAQGFRTWQLRALSSSTYGACIEGLNFVIYDYRGFGDSSPASIFPPTEKGLITDAKTVWDYMINSGADPANISIIGQSLGTGVSAGLAHRLLTEDNVKPNSLCLIAPFTSIPELLTTYRLFKVIPLLQPLASFPRIRSWLLDKVLETRFDTKSLISSITSNIMLIHAQNDAEVDASHSKSLFDHLHEYHSNTTTSLGSEKEQLPILLPSAHKQSHLSSSSQNSPLSDGRFKPIILSNEIPNFGKIHHFNRFHTRSQVFFLDAIYGGHNRVGYSGTAVRAMVDLICNP